MKKFFAGVGIFLLVIVVTIALVGIEIGGYYLGGFIGAHRENAVGMVKKARTEQDDKVFKESTQFIDGKVKQLSEYRAEYMKTKDPVVKQVMLDQIRTDLSDLDPDQIDNDILRQFFNDVMNYYITE